MSAVINPHQNQAPVLNPNLHQQLNLLAIGFLILAVATSIILYTSFAHSSLEKFFYGLMGVLLCLSTCLALKTSYTLWTNQNNPLAAFMLILYCCLFAIEWATVTGFTSQAQSKTSVNSKAAGVVKEQLKLADNRLQSLSQYQALSSMEIDTKRAALEGELDTLKTRLKSCNPNYISKCINPLELKIESKEKKYQALTNKFKNATAYTLASNEKNNLLNLSLDSSNIVEYHPLFLTISKLTDTHPAKVQANFLAFSALITTILTSFLFLIASVLKQRFVMIPVASENNNRPALPSQNYQNQQPQTQGFSFFDSIKQKFIDRLQLAKK